MRLLLFTTILFFSLADSGSSQSTISIDDIEFKEHPFFGYESYELSQNEISVLEDRGSWDYDEVLNKREDFELANEVRIQRGSEYWLRFQIESLRDTTLLIEAGFERLSSWDDVKIYVSFDDSIVHNSQTGIKLSNDQKEVNNAFNLLRIPLLKGMNTVHLKLAGFSALGDHPKWKSRFSRISDQFKIFIHNDETYFADKGYQFKGSFSPPRRGFVFNHNYFKQNIEVFVDESKKLELDQVRAIPSSSWTYLYEDYPDPESIYWVRLKLIGSDSHPSNYLMGLNTGGLWNFGEMDVYSVFTDGSVDHQKTGTKIPQSQKSLETKWNLFNTKVETGDTTWVYIRCADAGEKFVPEFTMSHIDPDTFWPRLFNIHLIYGAFLGILFVQAFYFLILGLIEKESLHLWFTCLIVGFGLGISFVGGDVNFFVLPILEKYHSWLTGLGVFMMVIGLYGYLYIFLSLKDLFSFSFDKILTPLILVHLIICVMFAVQLESIGGNIAVYEPYFQLLFASCIFNFIVGLGLGIWAWIKGSVDAKYFVGAFCTLIVILVVRLIFAFSSFQNETGFQQDTLLTGLYIHYVLFFGVVLTIVLLGFSNGYRINRLKLDRQAAFLRVQESRKRNELLKQKNQVIQQRVKEKDFLLKEVHHRVKNNLQILSSLLSLQSDSQEDESIINALQQSRNRVEAIGLIHQHLYTQDEMDTIDLHSYIDDLCIYMKDSIEGSEFTLDIIPNIQVDKVDVKTAMPLGLIINELVTNSIKHGFPDRKNGRVEINLSMNHDSEMILNISDNGIGKNTIEGETHEGHFGTMLVDLLARKLKGEIKNSFKNGYETELIFRRFKIIEQ